jgi:3-mercaptopyruvate sulfurtransferase SseA
MIAKGIKNASALMGGTAAWKGAKYPMETDEKPSDQNTPPVKKP